MPGPPRLINASYQAISTALILVVLLHLGIFAAAIVLLAAAGFRLATAPGTAITGRSRSPS